MSKKHYTYNESLDVNELKQGDVLRKTEGLRELLKKYHAYYADYDEYTHFQVLTQSCDLVRRGSEKRCSSRYITIAAVRSLETVIQRAIERYIDKHVKIGVHYCCRAKDHSKLHHEVESLFNNNTKDFFFLKAAPLDGLNDDSCTFLHLSIAIRAREHYELCLNAKTLELDEAFRAKLGWMVGNMYSRVGTMDYVPGALDDSKQFTELIDNTLRQHVIWIDDNSFPEFRNISKQGKSIEETLTMAKQAMENKRNSKKSQLIKEIDEAVELNAEQKERLRLLLESDRAKNLFLF